MSTASGNVLHGSQSGSSRQRHQKSYPIHEENISHQRHKVVQAMKIIRNVNVPPPPSSSTRVDGLLRRVPSNAAVMGPNMQVALVTCSGQMGAFLRSFTLTICLSLASHMFPTRDSNVLANLASLTSRFVQPSKFLRTVFRTLPFSTSRSLGFKSPDCRRIAAFLQAIAPPFGHVLSG